MFRYSLNFKNLVNNSTNLNYKVRNYSPSRTYSRVAKERIIENPVISRSLKGKIGIHVVNSNLDPNSKVLMYNGLFFIFCSLCSAAGVYYIDGKFSSFEENTNNKFISLEKNINDKFENLERTTNDS